MLSLSLSLLLVTWAVATGRVVRTMREATVLAMPALMPIAAEPVRLAA